MNASQADTWIIASAVVVAGGYGFERMKGQQEIPLTEFVTAWGVVFFVLALVATASPRGGAAFAILVMVADLLTTMPALTAAIKASGVPTTSTTSKTVVRPTSTTGAKA